MTDDTAAVDAALDYANSIRPYRDSFTTCERHLLTLADTLAQRTDGPTAPEPAALTLAQVDRFHNEVCIPDGGRCKCPEPAGSITDQSGEALLARQTGQGGADGVARRTAQTTDLMVPSASPLSPEPAAQPDPGHPDMAAVCNDSRCEHGGASALYCPSLAAPAPDTAWQSAASSAKTVACAWCHQPLGAPPAFDCRNAMHAAPAPGATTSDTDGGADRG